MHRPVTVTALALCLGALAWSRTAAAGEPVRVHVEAGGTHAVAGDQASQFAGGGEGKATVELPVLPRIGVQAGAGAIILGKGDPSADKTLAATSTGSAFLGTAGVRVRAFGSGHAGGPWIDSNMGVARTGDITRPAFDAHLGWDVRISEDSRIDMGPYLGYTQIFQPDGDLRGGDARMVTVGFQIGLGAKASARVAPPSHEAPPPPAAVFAPIAAKPDVDGAIEAFDACPAGEPAYEDGCTGDMHIYENKIVLQDVIHFDFGSAHVRGDSFALVKRLAKFIGGNDEITLVSIEGHADEVGTEEYNNQLSFERATAMRELLVWFGAPQSHLRVIGHGKHMLKVATFGPEQRNRRVELFVTTATANISGANAPHGKSSQ